MSDEQNTSAVDERISALDVAEQAKSEAADTPPEPPAKALPQFRLTHGDDIDVVEAIDEISARAFFNDRRGRWPNPRDVTVETL